MDDLNDLRLVLRSRFPLVIVESHEETKVRALVQKSAATDELAFFTWSVADGLARENFKYDVHHVDHRFGTVEGHTAALGEKKGRTHVFEDTHALMQALRHIDRSGDAGVYLLCDRHTTAATHDMLNAWAKKYPDLTKLCSIGTTLKGTPLMVLEITNHKTGAAEDKPAYYYDGNIHAGELTGAEVALRFAWQVLSKYETDPRIKNLLDTRALYIRPKFNPDGADLALTTLHRAAQHPATLRRRPRRPAG